MDNSQKDSLPCKICYHCMSFLFFFLSFLYLNLSLQLKGEYKVVKTLLSLSGFGWDEGDQMVTAPMSVWLLRLITFALPILMIFSSIATTPPVHLSANPMKPKLIPNIITSLSIPQCH